MVLAGIKAQRWARPARELGPRYYEIKKGPMCVGTEDIFRDLALRDLIFRG